LERLVIELSWKSSRIEGNTYTLLDTEKLILENTEAPGHTRDEARMILNHKDAFNFVRENASSFKTLSRAPIEALHAILVKDLDVGTGLRKRVVGVVGSLYQPLDNQHQVREALEALIEAVARMQTPYAKAVVALLGISYLQPFEDGNKRTARLLANGILLAYACKISVRLVSRDSLNQKLPENKEFRSFRFKFCILSCFLVDLRRICILLRASPRRTSSLVPSSGALCLTRALLDCHRHNPTPYALTNRASIVNRPMISPGQISCWCNPS
jgi:Fic/DOC family